MRRALALVAVLSRAAAAAAAPDLGAAPPGAPAPLCEAYTTPAPMTTSLTLYERAGRLSLAYLGPMESDIGRHFPMSLRRSGATLRVVIAPTSRPSSPGGVTLPAFGQNGGGVDLPPDLSGAFTLIITQGRDEARYHLEVDPAFVRLRELRPGRLLRLLSPADHPRPRPRTYALACVGTQGCLATACPTLFSLPALRAATALPPAPYLGPQGRPLGYPQCFLRIEDDAALASLRAALGSLRLPPCASAALVELR